MAANDGMGKSGLTPLITQRSANKSLRRREHGSGRDSSLNGSALGGLVKGEDNAPPQEPYPLIFKCAQCDGIFGDSTAWVREDQQMKTITISRTNVTLCFSFKVMWFS